MEDLFTADGGPEPPPQLDELAERELEVFRLIARSSNAEVAARELTTVKTQITHIRGDNRLSLQPLDQ